jgi:hypothetical protein
MLGVSFRFVVSVINLFRARFQPPFIRPSLQKLFEGAAVHLGLQYKKPCSTTREHPTRLLVPAQKVHFSVPQNGILINSQDS